MGAELYGRLVLPVLELNRLIEIDVLVLRGSRIVVVLPGIVALVDDRGVEAGRSGGPVEGILAIVAPGAIAAQIDRQDPPFSERLVIGQTELSAVIPVVRHVKQVASNGIRRCLQVGLRELAAAGIVVRQAVVTAQRDAPALVAAKFLDTETEIRVVGELTGLGVIARRSLIEALPAFHLNGFVVVVAFRLAAGIAEGRGKIKQILLAVRILEFEVQLDVVVRHKVLALGPGENVTAAADESRPLRTAARVVEGMIVVGRRRALQPLDARRVVVRACLSVGLDAAAETTGDAAAEDDPAILLIDVPENDDTRFIGNRCVVSTAHQGDLVLVVIAGSHHVARIEETAVVNHLVLAVAGHRRSGTDGSISEPALLELLLEFQVHHFLAVGGHTGELLRIAHFVDDLHLVHHLGGQVLERHLRIVEEEGLAAHGNLLDRLAIVFHGTVFRHLHTRHPFEQVFQHLVLPDLERRGIEDDGILPDLDRIADGRHMGGIEQLRILGEPDNPQVHRIPGPVEREVVFFVVGLVAQHLDSEHVSTARHFRDAGHARGVGQREVGDQRIVFGCQIGRGIRHRSFRLLFQDFDEDGTLVSFEKAAGNELRPRRYRGNQAEQDGKESFHTID